MIGLQIAIRQPIDMVPCKKKLNRPPNLATISIFGKGYEIIRCPKNVAFSFEITNSYPKIMIIIRITIYTMDMPDGVKLMGNFPSLKIRGYPPNANRAPFGIHKIFAEINIALLILSNGSMKNAVTLNWKKRGNRPFIYHIYPPGTDAQNSAGTVDKNITFI